MKNYLKSFFTEHWKYLAVHTACKLNVFEHLQEPKIPSELAKICHLHEDTLILLLNALHSLQFLDKQENHFQTNELSAYLTEHHPERLKYACMNWAEEHLTAWQHLDFSIQTGKSAFEKLYGTSFFEYLNQYPEKLHTYHKAMYEYAREDYKNLPEIIDFSEYTSVMDVGGGYGAVLEHVQNKNPQIHCILLDLPKVVEKIKNNAFEVIGANFFESIPKVTEAIILSRILHDWNDEKAKIILTNCYEALPKNGILFVIENCINKVTTDLSLLSLNMTVMCESFERTSTEYIYLAQNAGFEFKQDKKLNDLQTILIFQKI
jgi:hypothetical protein